MRILNLPELVWRKEATNPTIDDIPPYPNALWLNIETGEIFAHLKTCNGKAIWKGQFGTLIAPSTVSKFDVFGDGSAVALYRFEGNANDDGGQFNGTWQGNEQYDVGRFGWAAKFDGGSYIRIPQPIMKLPFSISLWVSTIQKTAGSKDWHNPTLVGFATSNAKSNDFGIEVKNGYLHIFSGFGVEIKYTTPKFVADGYWHHICVVFDTKECLIYTDGVRVVSFGQNSGTIDSSDWFLGVMIESNHLQTDSYFKGLIDQVRIFNRALTDEEVQILYNEMEEC